MAFGAPTLVDGVPWGNPLTPDGVTAAAVTAVAVTGQPEACSTRPGSPRSPAWCSPRSRSGCSSGRYAARSGFELPGWGRQPAARRMYFFVPLAVGLANWDPGVPSAEVEVWSMGGPVHCFATPRRRGRCRCRRRMRRDRSVGQ